MFDIIGEHGQGGIRNNARTVSRDVSTYSTSARQIINEKRCVPYSFNSFSRAIFIRRNILYYVEIDNGGVEKVRMCKLFSSLWTLLLCSGCSVGMALSGQEEKDTSVFYNGAERSFVQAKVGLPDSAVQDKDGHWIDTYLIVKGNEPSAGRAIGHGALDVLTLGLWEVFGTPIEAAAGSEEESRFVIYYDANQKIEKVDRIFVESKPVDEDANLRQAPTAPLEQAK